MGETTKFERVAVDTLVPYVNNANIHSDKQITMLASSIREFGFLNPILIDKDRNVIAGHGRILAAQKLGLSEVPCVYVEGLTEAQRKAYILADNRLAEFSEWDMELVMDELEGLRELNFDIELTGFEMEEQEAEVVEDDYNEEAVEVEPRAKLGDIWQLGEHRLICGDSTDAETVERLMNGEEADLLMTDPPYNVDVEGKAGKILNDNMNNDSFRAFLKDAFNAAFSHMRGGAAYYIWHSESEGYNFRAALNDINVAIRQCLIWNKNMFVLGRQDYQWKHEPCLYGWVEGSHYFVDDRRQSTVIEDRQPDFRKMKKDEMIKLLEEIYDDRVSTTVLNENKPVVNELHPTMKPLKLIGRLIKNSSKQGWKVLDTFGGSGSTLIACEQLNRRCFMCELDPHYVDVIIDRWQQFTGEKAELISEA